MGSFASGLTFTGQSNLFAEHFNLERKTLFIQCFQPHLLSKLVFLLWQLTNNPDLMAVVEPPFLAHDDHIWRAKLFHLLQVWHF